MLDTLTMALILRGRGLSPSLVSLASDMVQNLIQKVARSLANPRGLMSVTSLQSEMMLETKEWTMESLI
jgi:hypothetical protein